jgi:hypothetical protein
MTTNYHSARRTTRSAALLSAVTVAAVMSAPSPVDAQAATESATADRAAPPAWSTCRFDDLPIAADLGAILPSDATLPPNALAALHGEIEVGTDCSLYDLPV